MPGAGAATALGPDKRAAALGDRERAAALAGLAGQEHHVLVVGGGVVGAGVALDAATRGLSVGLVEARDFASGTSSRSSKLIHGGLRYLEQLNFGLVREALGERALLLQRIAPHLVQPVSFLYPITHRGGWERAYVGTGVRLYDLLGFSMGQVRGLPAHKQLTRHAALELAPGLKRSAVHGAIRYWDAQVDDARFVITVLRTAASYGARVTSRTQVIGFLREGERVTGVRAIDLESGCELEIRAQQVVNATGVWTDDIQSLVGGRGVINVRASKGVHLVVPRDRIHSSTGIIVRTPDSVLLVIPWGRHWIIGTTDTDWSLDKALPAASRSDIEYVLGQVNRVLRVPLTPDDVEGVYAGLRPLLSGESEQTSKLSREHTVAHPVPGLVMIAGGKYTTYRLMARDAVDAVVHGLDGRVPRSCTDEVPLVGAEGFPALWNSRYQMARASGLHVARIEHLLHRYGTLIGEVLGLIEADPALGRPLAGADDYLRAEIVYAASHEGARHLYDALARRTHITIETWDHGVTVAAEAARLMAGPLGWDSRQTAREIEHFRAGIAAERASQQASDDQAADAIRLGAPDIVPLVGTAAGGRKLAAAASGRRAPRIGAMNQPSRPPRPRVLSGIQPTADSFHLGNYLGAVRQWVAMQDTHDAFYCVVDLHAITVPQEPALLRHRTRVAAAQLFAAGLDPGRCTVFVQSHVPEHTELAWVLGCLTGFGEASRMTQFKDKSARGGLEQASVGLFTYPILQAADILLYQADQVPVGEDQRQHLELTRDLAQRFNHRFGPTFTVPGPYILADVAKINDLQDPTAKMSKSSSSPQGIVDVLDEPDVIRRKFARAVTDAGTDIRADDAAKPGITNLLRIYSALAGTPVADLEARYAGTGYGAFKRDLAELVVSAFAPIRERTEKMLADETELDRLLADGARRAGRVARPTMTLARDRMGLLPPGPGSLGR